MIVCYDKFQQITFGACVEHCHFVYAHETFFMLLRLDNVQVNVDMLLVYAL